MYRPSQIYTTAQLIDMLKNPEGEFPIGLRYNIVRSGVLDWNDFEEVRHEIFKLTEDGLFKTKLFLATFK